MRKFWFIPFAAWLMLCGPILPCMAKWETWENCTLETDEYYDGDSFYIRRGPRSVYIIRLYFVDCPETDDRHKDRNREQARYFNCEIEALERYGRKAKHFTRSALRKPFTVYTEKQKAGGTSHKPRYFGFVQCGDGTWLGEELVKAGLARAYGAPADRPDGVGESRLRMRLSGYEKEARRQRIGIWGADDPDNPFYSSEMDRRKKLHEVLDSVQVLEASVPLYSVYDVSRRVGILKRGTRVYVRHVEKDDFLRIRFKKEDGRLTEALCKLSDLVR